MRLSAWVGAFLVLLLALFAVAPLAYPGFFESHSGFLASFRVQQLARLPFLDASEPVRGEGSLATFTAWPFFWLFGNGVVAIRVGYALSFLLGALALYDWARLRLGTEGGVVAATIYSYLPWHLATVYFRGAYAEAWLWVLWPAVLLAWEAPVPRGRWLLRLCGLGLAAAALLVQPGLTFLFLGLLVPYAVAVWRVDWWPPRVLAAAVAAGVIVSGAWAAGGLPGGNRFVAQESFLHPFQLLSAAWADQLAGDALPFQLGAAAVALSLLSLGLWAIGRHRRAPVRPRSAEGAPVPEPPEKPPARRRFSTPESPGAHPPALGALHRSLGFWLAALLVVLFFTLRLSSRIWNPLWLGSLVTDPWQLLALTGLPLAFLAGSSVRLDRRLAERPVWAGLAALAVLASYAYLAPRFTQVDPGAGPVAEFQPRGEAAPTIHLLEVGLTPSAEITSTVGLTLTWQALAPVETEYAVFVHLLAGDDRVAQADSWPCSGACPTRSWMPGQIVVDCHEIRLPAGAPAGPYRVAVGLYQEVTGERVAVVGRDDGTVILDVR